MTYEQLLKWATEKGKTEQDLVIWLARSDVQAVRDMTDQEMVEWLLDGVKYDAVYFKSWWEGLDDEGREAMFRHIQGVS